MAKKKAQAKEGKHPGGRPRTKTPSKWTPEQLGQIDEWAKAQAKDTTIASALGVDTETFRREFRERTEQKRAEGKIELLVKQKAEADKGNATMLVWLGKQHLGQKDKQEVEHGASEKLAQLLGWVADRNGAKRDDDAHD